MYRVADVNARVKAGLAPTLRFLIRAQRAGNQIGAAGTRTAKPSTAIVRRQDFSVESRVMMADGRSNYTT